MRVQTLNGRYIVVLSFEARQEVGNQGANVSSIGRGRGRNEGLKSLKGLQGKFCCWPFNNEILLDERGSHEVTYKLILFRCIWRESCEQLGIVVYSETENALQA